MPFAEARLKGYTILFYKSPAGDHYRIVVYDDKKAVEVEVERLATDEYILTIRREILGKGEGRKDETQLYGKKFKKNFETMKKLIDKFFPQ